MAERRMFAKSIIDSDAFIDMPISARLLYYDLSMRADDDGFVNSPKKIMKMIGVAQNDIDLLILKKFIIPFESGIVVIKHWRIHNYIRKDTYNETNYKEEKAQLELDENKAYRYKDCEGRLRTVHEPSTQVRLGKDSIDNKEKELSNKSKTNFDKIIEEENFSKETVERLNDFIKMRKSIKKPLTDRALKIIVNKLKKITQNEEEMRAMLDRSILNSWQDVYELKPEEKKEFLKQDEDVYEILDVPEEEYWNKRR